MRAKCIGTCCVLLASLVDVGAAGGAVRLVDAVRNGDTAAVRALLIEGAEVNAAEADGATALHWAIYRDDLTTVRLLIRAGANVEAANRYGVRPLSLASANGNAQTVEVLLEAGADPTAMTAGEPPIMSAARTGNVEAVTLLARYGADVNATETLRGQTALMWAVAERHPVVAQALIDLGADVHARSAGGGLEQSNILEAVPLMSRKVKEGFTALLFAARQGALESTRVLVTAGANVRETAPRGSNALLIATNNYHYELAAFLVERGADSNATDTRGNTALHAAVLAETLPAVGSPARTPTGQMDRVSFIRFLLAHGADPDARLAAVPDAPLAPDPDARLAPQKPRDANTRDTLGDLIIDSSVSVGGATPFFLAARAADLEVMRLLVAHGADPRVATFGNTSPLAVAAGIGYSQVRRQPPEDQVLQAVRLAVELGNDANLANTHGQTPLHGAVYRGIDAAIQLLIDNGARLDAADAVGRTPLKLAEEGFYQLASRLPRDSSAALLAQLGHDTPEAARVRRLNPTPR